MYSGTISNALARANATHDDPVMTNKMGGSQSDIQVRTDLMPPLALIEVSKILHRGAEKYGEDNWHAISTAENLNHAIKHAYEYLADEQNPDRMRCGQEDHLAHAACRMMMALEIRLRGGPQEADPPCIEEEVRV